VDLAQDPVDGVIATSSAAASAPMTTEQKIANILAVAPKEDAMATPTQAGPRQVHGGGGLTIGSDGYRAGYAYALIPVGESGTLGVAYGQSQGGRRGYSGGPGGGRGPGGRGQDGVSQTLNMSLNFDAANAAPEGCAPAFMDGSRPIEPVWASEMRGRSACSAGPRE
jgi:hypothetical protein